MLYTKSKEALSEGDFRNPDAQARRYLKVLTDCGVVKSEKLQKEMFIQGFNAIRSFNMSEL